MEPGHVQEFLDPLPVERLWGVGKQGSKVFQRLGIRTIGQLRQCPVETLKDRFDSQGEHLWRLAHGIDDDPVVPEREAKSISHETTFAQDITDRLVLRTWLSQLTDQVARRLRRHGYFAQVVHVKVRFDDFRTITRSHKLAEPTNVTDELWQVACDIFTTRLPAAGRPVRLIGMGVSRIAPLQAQQGLLFDNNCP